MNDIDKILDKIRSNSAILASYHRKRFIVLKARLRLYRIPIIVISALNSVGAVSFQNFVEQKYISLINMFLSLVVGIISSIELFNQISAQMEVELIGSKDFYVLSIDIFKYLSLDKSKREIEEKIFLSDTWTRYTKLIETSYLLKKKVDDKLAQLAELPDHPANIPLIASSGELFVDTSSEDTP
jgi:hypothetical protein